MKYKPNTPYLVPMYFAKPIIKKAKGVEKKDFEERNYFRCSFKTFGGTEKIVNGVLSVEDTAIIETWYRSDITSDCIVIDNNDKKYEIIGTPENIECANKILKFKIRAIKGGA